MVDINSYLNDPAIAQARDTASSAAGNVASMSQAVNLLPYKLRDAINEKLDYNKDLIEQKNKAMENYFAAPAEGRQQYSNVWNPTQREALVSRATAQAYTPYANLSDILATRMGGISDLIGAAGAQGRADLSTANDQAQLTRQYYQDLLGEAKDKTALAMDIEKMNGSGSDGGGDLLSELLGLSNGGVDTGEGGGMEEPPMSSPYGKTNYQTEYPIGSGIIWQSDGKGGWN